MNLFLGEKVLSALHFAAIAHRDQLRLGPNNIPYITHPASVGHILWKAGFSEDVTAAGILHDVIEDTSYTYADIEKEFGSQIADWVQDVSEDKNLDYVPRKESYLKHLSTAPDEAKAISGADLLSNRYTMLLESKTGFTLWKRPELQINFDLQRLEILRPSHLPFMAELEEVLRRVHEQYK